MMSAWHYNDEWLILAGDLLEDSSRVGEVYVCMHVHTSYATDTTVDRYLTAH